jgi:anti-anti-sigma factor
MDASVHGSRVQLRWIPAGVLKLGEAYRLEIRPESGERLTCIAEVRHIGDDGVGLEIREQLPVTPSADEAAAAVAVVTKRESRDGERTARRSGHRTASKMGRILVVDDDPEICKLVADYFTPKGYEVTNVGDADEALELMRQDPPHLVLLDMNLPGCNGLEALRRVREQYPAIGVIIITAYQDPKLAQATLQLGAVNYLVKPFDLDRLDRVVRWNIRLSAGLNRGHVVQLAVSQTGDVTVVAPDADIDMNTADQLKAALTDLVESGGLRRLVLDLDAVSYMDSSGLGALVSAMKVARAAGGDLKLCGIGDNVRSVLEMTGLAGHLAIHTDPQDAVAAFN